MAATRWSALVDAWRPLVTYASRRSLWAVVCTRSGGHKPCTSLDPTAEVEVWAPRRVSRLFSHGTWEARLLHAGSSIWGGFDRQGVATRSH